MKKGQWWQLQGKRLFRDPKQDSLLKAEVSVIGEKSASLGTKQTVESAESGTQFSSKMYEKKIELPREDEDQNISIISSS